VVKPKAAEPYVTRWVSDHDTEASALDEDWRRVLSDAKPENSRIVGALVDGDLVPSVPCFFNE